MATAPAGPLDVARRTAWSRAAAACSLALTGLLLDLLARGAEPQAYLVVVLVLAAVVGGLAGVGVAVRNCVVSRAIAVTVAAGALAGSALLATLGTPGSSGPEPLGAAGILALALGLAVPVLVAADASCRSVRRVHRGGTATGPVLSTGADSRAARGGRPRHCAHAGPSVGA